MVLEKNENRSVVSNQVEGPPKTMKSKATDQNPNPRWRCIKASLRCASLVLAFASTSAAGPFFDEMVLDHRGHDHSGETNRFGFVDGIDASCDLEPSIVCTNFDGSDFGFTDIADSIFIDATFTGATLDDVFISQSDFTGAMLDGASFKRATVRGGSFDGANLSGTDLTDTQFRCTSDLDDDETSFDCPSFIDTDFTSANLTSVLIAPNSTTTNSCCRARTSRAPT